MEMIPYGRQDINEADINAGKAQPMEQNPFGIMQVFGS